jgi:phage shock protein A
MAALGLGDIAGWVRDLVKDVTTLTSNVKVLQSQVESLSDTTVKQQREIANLQADLRVAKEEMRSVATTTAAQTIIQAHTQMIEKFNALEALVRRNGGDGPDRLRPPDDPD